MRHFNYYLFDSYDADEVSCPNDDPRSVLNAQVDEVLTAVVASAPGLVKYDSLCCRFTKTLVDNLIHIGLLRKENTSVRLDTPVILQEDAAYLQRCFTNNITRMVNALSAKKEEFYKIASQLDNGFTPQVNLYHLLCGAILDGSFFDYISSRDIVATSRVHESGLDYLIIAYEKSQALDAFSEKLLCSYNRFSDGTRSMQSFGDADGIRQDLYRFATQKRLGKVPQHWKHIEKLWDTFGAGDVRKVLLDEMQEFVETGRCEERCQNLFSEFGYIQNGRLAVPVYRSKHQPIIQELEALAENYIYQEMKEALSSAEIMSGLVCGRHGVSAKEIANEMYHVIFGQMNEILVSTGFVAEPPRYETEGRYLKSIELD